MIFCSIKFKTILSIIPKDFGFVCYGTLILRNFSQHNEEIDWPEIALFTDLLLLDIFDLTRNHTFNFERNVECACCVGG